MTFFRKIHLLIFTILMPTFSVASINCSGDISPTTARLNLTALSLSSTSNEDRSCIAKSIETLGQLSVPEDIPLLLMFLEFRVADTNPNPKGIMLHMKIPGYEYPAINALAREGRSAEEVLLNEISHPESSPLKRKNATMALLQANSQRPENVIRILKARKLSMTSELDVEHLTLIDQALQFSSSSIYCQRKLTACQKAQSE